jgi:PAS domain S-box-containing protein
MASADGGSFQRTGPAGIDRRMVQGFISPALLVRMNWVCRVWILAILIAAGTMAAESRASSWAVPEDSTSVIDLAPHLSVLIDPKAGWEIDQVLLAGKRFEPLPHKVPSFGYTHAAVWLRFKIVSSSDETKDLIVELGSARPSHLTWHVVNAGRLERSVSAGSADLPRRAERLPMLALALPPGEERTVYLRIEPDTAMLLPLRIGHAGAMRQAGLRKATIDALEVGLCLAITLLGLLLAVVRRARLYLHLALIAASYLLYFVIFHGYVTYMWPQAPLWVERQMQGIATGGALLAFALFNKSLLTYPKGADSVRRWLGRVSLGLPWIIIASFLVVEFREAVRLLEPLAFIGILAGLALVGSRGVPRREDFWFAAAWGGLGLTLILLTLQFKDLVPVLIPIRNLQFLIVPSILAAFFIAVLMRQRVSEAEEKQRWAERQAHDLVGNIAAGTYEVTLHPDGRGRVSPRFRFASPQFLEMFGLGRDELMADPAVIASRIHPHDSRRLDEANAGAFATQSKFRWEGRVRVGAQTRCLVIASTPRKTIDELTVWSGLVTDVTAEKQAQKALEQTLEDLPIAHPIAQGLGFGARSFQPESFHPPRVGGKRCHHRLRRTHVQRSGHPHPQRGQHLHRAHPRQCRNPRSRQQWLDRLFIGDKHRRR